MENKSYKLTQSGLDKLKIELNQLKVEERMKIAEKIKQALSFGDLSENSEYDEAKNEQAIVETRINELENMIKNSEIIDEDSITGEEVITGVKVIIKDLSDSSEEQYQIVGTQEANPMQMMISDESPLGRALIGKKAGNKVEIDAPGGKMKFKILKIIK